MAGSTVVTLMFIAAPVVCVGFMSFLVCSTLCPFQLCNHLTGEESTGCLIFYFLIDVMLLLSFFASSSRCHGLVSGL